MNNNSNNNNIEKFRIAVTGAVSPEGSELVRLILSHPMCELCAVSSSGHEGHIYSDLLPAFRGRCDLPLLSEAQLIEAADVVFNADPGLDAQALAAACINGRSVLIDLGSDFRFNDQTLLAQWHGGQYLYPTLHEAALYCIPELMRGQLAGKVLVSCPGAAAQAAILSLAPLLLDGLIYPENIVINVSVPVQACTAYTRSNSGFASAHSGARPFLIGELPDTGEIESILTSVAGTPVRATLIPFAVPADRGLTAACCVRTHNSGNEQNLRAAFEKLYASERYIRLLPRGADCSPSYSLYTNYCDISVTRIERTGSAAVVCTMDYFMKGSAGCAVQIMNSLLNMPEDTGLH